METSNETSVLVDQFLHHFVQPSAEDVLQELYAQAAGNRWAEGMLASALTYVRSEGQIVRIEYKYTTQNFFFPDARQVLEAIQVDHYPSLFGSRILESAIGYINGYTCSHPEYNTKNFFNDYQLGMLGRVDGPLSKQEARLDTDETVLVKCVTEEHEYPEGDEPDCECEILDSCECAINPDDTSVCSNCGNCEACCDGNGECFSCLVCDEACSLKNQCVACSKCSGCCLDTGSCWSCEGCDKRYSSANDQYSCDRCEECDSCCGCNYCSACEHKHESEIIFCSGCDNCADYCNCSPTCNGCDASDEEYETDNYCSDCHRCGPCGCHCPPPPPPPYQPVTQKAKGLITLRSYLGGRVPSFNLIPAKGANPLHLVNRFVRPCPVTPRHGFVDSRLVSDEAEATQVIAETLAADENAEFILMSKLEAVCSAIWTPGIMVLGAGNDGATAGRTSVTIPVGGELFERDSLILEKSGITNSPYAEIIWTGSYSKPKTYRQFLVQLRDGPKVTQQTDYIAASVTVSKVILAEGDLLEWESLMKNQPAGTVVHHPGGSLASHYAVHAVLNSVPVLVSREPKVGDVLLPTEEVDASKPDMERMRAGFFYALSAESDYIAACYMMLLGCHSTTLWLSKQDFLLGVALGFAYRLSITAGIGEWRHRPGRKENAPKPQRHVVYENVWPSTHKLRRVYMRTLRDFRVLPWESGMGGEKWFQFTQWAAMIFNGLKAGDYTAALAAMNNAVHSSHNNGWGFNKFANDGAMDQVAADPVTALEWCGPLVYKALTADSGATAEAHKWFVKTKTLAIANADLWLRDTRITRDNAQFGQAKLSGSKITLQYKSHSNSLVYNTETIEVPKNVEEKLKALFVDLDQTGDGRFNVSYDPQDKDGYIKASKFIKNDKSIRHGQWIVYGPDGMACANLHDFKQIHASEEEL